MSKCSDETTYKSYLFKAIVVYSGIFVFHAVNSRLILGRISVYEKSMVIFKTEVIKIYVLCYYKLFYNCLERGAYYSELLIVGISYYQFE